MDSYLLKTTTLSIINKQFVKIAIYITRNAMFVYMSIHVYVPTLFSMQQCVHVNVFTCYYVHKLLPESYSSRTIKCLYEVTQCLE